MGARAVAELDEVQEFHAYGAGIPGAGARDNALHYKFSWSPIGRDAIVPSPRAHRSRRARRGDRSGDALRAAPLHLLDVPGLGAPLECYPNGDAAHYAELFGLAGRVREMARYTGRLPGHCAFWDVLVKCGFLDGAPLAVGGASVAPLEFTAALLDAQPRFHYADDEADLTFMRVDVSGMRGGRAAGGVRPLDTRDFDTGFTSMQRTVGYTLALGARLILDARLPKRGLLTPLDVPYELGVPAAGATRHPRDANGNDLALSASPLPDPPRRRRFRPCPVAGTVPPTLPPPSIRAHVPPLVARGRRCRRHCLFVRPRRDAGGW